MSEGKVGKRLDGKPIDRDGWNLLGSNRWPYIQYGFRGEIDHEVSITTIKAEVVLFGDEPEYDGHRGEYGHAEDGYEQNRRLAAWLNHIAPDGVIPVVTGEEEE